MNFQKKGIPVSMTEPLPIYLTEEYIGILELFRIHMLSMGESMVTIGPRETVWSTPNYIRQSRIIPNHYNLWSGIWSAIYHNDNWPGECISGDWDLNTGLVYPLWTRKRMPARRFVTNKI